LGLDVLEVIETGAEVVEVFWETHPLGPADIAAARSAVNSYLTQIRGAITAATCGSAVVTDIRLIPKDLPGKLAGLTRGGSITLSGVDAIGVTGQALDVVSVLRWGNGGELASFMELQEKLANYLAGGKCSNAGCQDLCDAMRTYVDSVPNVSPNYIDAMLIDFAHKLCYASCPCGP
jgi:hypothetical protein